MKCDFLKCGQKQSIIGKCNYCKNTFCIAHRLQECHNCVKATESNKTKHKVLSDLLEENRTKETRGLAKF
jgi:predicted nucleic acid binding AN1-type Zn finger protein